MSSRPAQNAFAVLLAALLTLAHGPAAWAEGGPPPDRRRDFYQIDPAETDLLRYAEANCIAVRNSDITDVGDGTYKIDSQFWTVLIDPTHPLPLCEGTRFLGQQSAGRSSGVLVGHDLILTALHTAQSQAACDDRWYVFDYFQIGPDEPPVDPSGGPSAIIVPKDNVYKCIEWIPVSSDPFVDMVLLRMDRQVVGRRPMKIRRTLDTIDVGTPIVTLGHPQSLPMKLDQGTIVNSPGPLNNFLLQIHNAHRGSGSMLVNEMTGELLGVMATIANAYACPVGAGCCTDFSGWFNVPAGAENATRVADAIPEEVGLIVDPHNHVVDSYGSRWGPFNNFRTDYKLSVSENEPRNIDFDMSMSQSGWIFQLNGGTDPIMGTLSPGQSFEVPVNPVRLCGAYPRGVHEAVVTVNDFTYMTKKTITHRLHVEANGFTLAPEEDFVGDGPGALPDDTFTYTLNNRHITSQDIRITTPASWIRIDGAVAPVDLTLPPAGPNGSMDVSISFNAAGLGNGVYHSTLTFDPWPHEGLFRITRGVLLDVGREHYSIPAPVDIDATNGVAPISVPHGIRFLDVDLQLELWFEGNEELSFILDLVSPELANGDRITVRLYEENQPRHIHIDEIYDDMTNPPPTGGKLSDFTNLVFVQGNWELHARTATGDPLPGFGTIHSATLRVTPAD